MLRLLRWVICLPIVFIVLGFALVNRGDVTLSFWPSDVEIALPLSLLIVGVFFAGALFGQALAWLGSLGRRIEAARLKRAMQKLQSDQAVLPPKGETIGLLPAKQAPFAKLTRFFKH